MPLVASRPMLTVQVQTTNGDRADECSGPAVTREEFVKRYGVFARTLGLFLILLLLPFFGALFCLLFLTEYPFHLLDSWKAAASGVAVVVLCFGGISLWFVSVPLALRLAGLVCPVCRRPPRWLLLERRFALRTTCAACGAQVFRSDWPATVLNLFAGNGLLTTRFPCWIDGRF